MTVIPPATAHHVVSRLMRESLVDKNVLTGTGSAVRSDTSQYKRSADWRTVDHGSGPAAVMPLAR